MLLEACVGRPIERLVYASSSSVYGDDVAMPMREDALPQPVSPYGVTKLAAEQLCYLYHVELRRADRLAALLHRLRPAAAARHGLPPFLRAALQGRADHGVRRRRADARLHVRRRRGGGDDRGRRARRARARLQYRRRLARVDERGARDDRARRRPPAQIVDAKPRRRATCATPTPTRRWRAPTSASRPTVSLEEGLAGRVSMAVVDACARV